MIQQINLYQELVQEKKAGPNKPAYIIGASLLILLVLCYCAWQAWQVHQLNAELAIKQAQLNSEISDLSGIQQQYPKQEINPLLASELDRLQNISASVERVVALLSDQQSDKNTGFSTYLNALAEQSISTIWLSQISIDSETNAIQLQGSTYLPDTLPQLIKRLNKEAVFKGRYFAHLHMQASENNAKQINFTISTQVPEEKPAL
ncbi:MAG: PilN domain-containing protein [Methyloprofundus sp.]|nr:PilN domain-containing protein [Methyloprofundus sp.]MBW6452413.1 PilN domain-containing protein [Methyloprofundus sp.]